MNCDVAVAVGERRYGDNFPPDFVEQVKTKQSSAGFVFCQKRVNNLMYYAWTMGELRSIFVCYNGFMIDIESEEALCNIASDLQSIGCLEEKTLFAKAKEYLQKQSYMVPLPLFSYAKQATEATLSNIDAKELAKYTDTNSTVFVLLQYLPANKITNAPNVETFTVKGVEFNTTPADTNLNSNVETFTVKGVEFNMVKVGGGTFMMGAAEEQGNDANSDEKPVHPVTISDYYIGQTQVTQELWQAVMGRNPSHYMRYKQCPVENVSWNDCQKFISRLNKLTGRNFCLPTEAEWEFAARGGNKSRGYKYSGSNKPDEVAWYEENSGGTTHSVAQKRANELGLFDMSGNVWEWCCDTYKTYSSRPQTDPISQTSGDFVVRGGSIYQTMSGIRVSYRNLCSITSSPVVGLRLALSNRRDEQGVAPTSKNKIPWYAKVVGIAIAIAYVLYNIIWFMHYFGGGRTETATETATETCSEYYEEETVAETPAM